MDFRTTQPSDPAVMASHESYSSTYAPIRSEKVVSPGFPEIYKLQRETTVPSGSSSNSEVRARMSLQRPAGGCPAPLHHAWAVGRHAEAVEAHGEAVARDGQKTFRRTLNATDLT